MPLLCPDFIFAVYLSVSVPSLCLPKRDTDGLLEYPEAIGRDQQESGLSLFKQKPTLSVSPFVCVRANTPRDGWSMLIEDMLTSTSPIDNLRKSSSMMTDGLTTDSSRKTIYDSAIYIHCSKLFARTTCLE
uniref:Ovule protein n=1 Tax=Steinernema glaseri TaxID=37863 RepID=A0A1I7ZFU2_9BILA